MLKASLLTSVFMIASTPLLAGSLAQPEETPYVITPSAPQVDWSGFYLGGQIGAGELSGAGVSFDTKFAGVHAGYNYSIQNYVVGVELGYDSANIDAGGVDFDADVTRLKFRAGYSFGRVMAYGAVGASHIDIDTVGDTSGYNVGLGINYLATDNIVIGAEYLHDDGYDITGVDADADSFSLRVSYKF